MAETAAKPKSSSWCDTALTASCLRECQPDKPKIAKSDSQDAQKPIAVPVQ